MTAISATNAWAVGEDIGATSAIGGSTLIEHWNGASWSIVPSPTPGADPGLTGVAARGSGDVYAVGNNIPSINGGVVQGLILRWNGSTWSQDTDPADGSYSPLFAAAAAPGAANEWAAGAAVERGPDSQPRLTGTQPSMRGARDPAAPGSQARSLCEYRKTVHFPTYERLHSLVARLGDLTAVATAEAIQLATLTFSGGRLGDDTVALVMKVPA